MVKMRHIEVQNFHGIKRLIWVPSEGATVSLDLRWCTLQESRFGQTAEHHS